MVQREEKGLFLLSGPLISTIFLGGSFSDYDLMMTDISLRGYSIGIIGLCMVLVLSPAGDKTKTIHNPIMPIE